jgi:hypothetical protein
MGRGREYEPPMRPPATHRPVTDAGPECAASAMTHAPGGEFPHLAAASPVAGRRSGTSLPEKLGSTEPPVVVE